MLLKRWAVAEMLGKSVSTVKRLMRNDPRFPVPWRRKRTVRFRKQDIEEYIKYSENRDRNKE